MNWRTGNTSKNGRSRGKTAGSVTFTNYTEGHGIVGTVTCKSGTSEGVLRSELDGTGQRRIQGLQQLSPPIMHVCGRQNWCD